MPRPTGTNRSNIAHHDMTSRDCDIVAMPLAVRRQHVVWMHREHDTHRRLPAPPPHRPAVDFTNDHRRTPHSNASSSRPIRRAAGRCDAGTYAAILGVMSNESRMVFLGFGKFARADKIYALEPLRGDERGDGKRTRVWVEGLTSPIIASRTERTILHDMGQDAAAEEPIVAEALDLAERLAAAAEAGRVDLGDLGRRARRLLASTTMSPDDAD